MEPAPRSRQLLLTKPGEKLLVPRIFNGSESLDVSNFYPFSTAGSIKTKLDEEMTDWVSPKVAYALLSNADSFWLDFKDEKKIHGGCAVVKTVYFIVGENFHGYGSDADARSKERDMKNLNCEVDPGVPGTPVLKRFDIHGSTWSRRRYTLQDNDTYSFVQWMDAKDYKLKKKPVTTRLEDVAERVKAIDESQRAMRMDVADMKVLSKNCSTLSEALAESLKQVVKDHASANAAIIEQIEKLRTEIRMT